VTSQEAKEILKSLITRIDTQDNRATAKPFLHLLRVKRRIFVPTSNDGGWWIDTQDSEIEAIQANNRIQAASILSERYEITVNPDFLEECDLVEWWETRNVFLTKEGLNQHLKLNAHNLEDEYQDYMIHAFRNPEISALFDAIRTLVVD
jgi:hypothetical protein